MYLHGLALKSLGRYNEAVESLAASSQLGPPSADVFYHLSEAQSLAGDQQGAHHSVLAALKVDRSEIKALLN